MLRGVLIDFDTARKALTALEEVYIRDLEAREISDDTISAVNTVLRSVEGAMGKTANAVGVKYVKPGRIYFPLTDNPADFRALLENNLPGLAANHPAIAKAFENHQPFQPGKETLGLLKALYRENHHHDFTAQERRDTQSFDLLVDSMTLISHGPHGFMVGNAPPWRGIPVRRTTTESKEGTPIHVEFQENYHVDWYFKEPNVSVLGTLGPLYNLCVFACDEVSARAGL